MKSWIVVATLPLLGLASAVFVLAAVERAEADPSLDASGQVLLQLVNDYRQENGVASLVPSPELNAAADWFANDMASKAYFPEDHIDSLGRNPTQRGAAFGYPGQVGENLGAGPIFTNPQTIFEAWQKSPGHNANMLSGSFKMAGVASVSSGSFYGVYWVLDLGTLLTGQSPGPSTSPAPTTPEPSPTPAATPPRSPSPTPSPTPAPLKAVQGDADCDLAVRSTDALVVLRSDAGYAVEDECIGYGDVDCDGDQDAVDALAILRWIISDAIAQDSGCPPIGAAA